MSTRSIPTADKTVGFVIAGTQKGGTSALDAYLRTHPAICMATRKEVHFFDDESLFANGTPDYAAYHRYFSPTDGQWLLGEATPIYMYWHSAPERMRRYNDEMRIIITLRNPIDRAFSHWNMERDRGAENLSFSAAIRLEKERCQSAHPQQHRVYSYVDRGHYARQLQRIWSCFPKEQTLVIRHEALRDDPQSTLDQVCRFLQLSPMPTVTPQVVHSRPYPQSMLSEDWDYLASCFAPDINELELLLGWDCRDWLHRPESGAAHELGATAPRVP